MATPAQVVVFLDYQNVYHGARRAFHNPLEPGYMGNVSPIALGELLAAKGPPEVDRALKQVRIYRGMPENSKDPKTYGAARRQIAAWNQSDRVEMRTRVLNYRGWPDDPPREKGIDVLLAIDFVMMAVSGAFDVGVLMSTDTDLKPALEAVSAMPGNPYPRCEVATWAPSNSHARRLSVKDHNVWCHFLDENDYAKVEDPTDYNIGR